jgi:3-oxoacyl-[acyl-carrier protein] reductase
MKSDAEILAAPTALIIGGSGGIGGAICREFAAARWRIAVHFHRHRDRAEKVRDDLHASGTEAMLCAADVRDMDATRRMVDELVSAWGRLDAVVYAAGTAAGRLLLRQPADEWDDIVRTNVTGVFHCLQAAGRHMTERRRGSIVVIGSFAGSQGAAGQAAYATSKAALTGLVRTAAREWAEARVRVNLVFPGWHRTALSEDAMPDPGGFDDHLLGAPPALTDTARAIRHLAELSGVSGQIWNLDSRLLP